MRFASTFAARSWGELLGTVHRLFATLIRRCAYAAAYAGRRYQRLHRIVNSTVARWSMPPATKYGRFSRLVAYAQAADQHVWSAASVFLGTVCGDLLRPCVCSLRRVARTRAARTLRFRDRDVSRTTVARACPGWRLKSGVKAANEGSGS